MKNSSYGRGKKLWPITYMYYANERIGKLLPGGHNFTQYLIFGLTFFSVLATDWLIPVTKTTGGLTSSNLMIV